MSLADGQYDVKLNGHGFILMEESYRKKAQPAFNNRFSTGDYSLFDLSFWQYIGITDFSGGSGQLKFTTTNKFFAASGWETFNKGIRPSLTKPAAKITFAADPPAFSAPAAGAGIVGKAVVIGGAIHWFYPSTSTPTGQRTNTDPSSISGHPKMAYYDTTAKCFMERSGTSAETTGGSRFITQKYEGTNKDIGNSLTINADTSTGVGDGTGAWNPNNADATASSLGFIFAIEQIAYRTLLMIKNYTSTRVFFTRYNIDERTEKRGTNGSGTVLNDPTHGWFDSLSLLVPTSGLNNALPLMFGSTKDASGNLYFVIQEQDGANNVLGSTIVSLTNADAQSAGPSVVSNTVYIANFICESIENVAGTVYLFGAYKFGTTFYQAILKYPGTIVFISTVNQASYDPIKATHSTGSLAYYISNSELSGNACVNAIDTNGNIQTICELFSYSMGTTEAIALAMWGGRAYALRRNGQIWCSGTGRGDDGQIARTSQLGVNTSLINKAMLSVKVELDRALTNSDHDIDVYVVDDTGTSTLAGSLSASSGDKIKELTLSTPIVSTYFSIQLKARGTYGDPAPLCLGVVIKEVPTPLKKLAWGFGLRATKQLKRADGTKETDSTSTIFSNLINAWNTNTPIAFVDVDGTSYTVIITDFDQRRPLLDRRGGSNSEALFFVEVLQV